MADGIVAPIGTVAWADLTVADSVGIRDFYEDITGWTPKSVDMGGYEDFEMLSPETGASVAGICTARGANADLPAQWLVYFHVADVDLSAERVVELGGKILSGPRELGVGRFCVIQDPAGAVCALWNPGVDAHAMD